LSHNLTAIPDRRPGVQAKGIKTVLYIDDAVSFGGSLIATSLLIKHLDPQRYRPVVVGEAPGHVLEYLFSGHATVYRITRLFNYRSWIAVQHRLQSRTPVPVRVALNYLMTAVGSLLNLGYHLRLTRIILRERVDLIHHSNGTARPFLLLFHRPLVGTMAGLPKRRFSWLRRWIIGRHRKMIMISEVVRQGFVRSGGSPEITELIPNPTDPQVLGEGLREALCRRYDIPRDAKVFGIVGRVVPWKGQKEFLAAAERVLAEVPGSVAVIIGDAADGGDDYFAEVRSLAAESSFADRIRFTGYVERVNEIYGLLDVAVHASIQPEPFGLVIIEAMGHGVPIVAAASGAAPEIIEPGEDGFLADPTDPGLLAAAISRLLTDDDLRREMATRGKRKVREKYHAASYAKAVQAVYDEVLAS
jgi:glycosyltransferase involved in cell wall biosynthesis